MDNVCTSLIPFIAGATVDAAVERYVQCSCLCTIHRKPGVTDQAWAAEVSAFVREHTTYTPTPRLRWLRSPPTLSKPGDVRLQQLWVNVNGKEQWRFIPVVEVK